MNKKSLLIASALFLTLSCGSKSESKGNEGEVAAQKTSETTNDSSVAVTENIEVKEVVKVEYDTRLTDMARVIAGVPVEGDDALFLSIQEADYYKDYQAFVKKTFDKVQKNMLAPIKKWTAENNVEDDRDGVTCFYPFSGPDFLFANTFYPKAENYILLGLEKRGSLPDFDKMDERARKKYFKDLMHSMKYINTRGYFVTSHMSSDYNQSNLNGIVHMVLYMMIHTDHKIIRVQDAYLNKVGKMTRIAENEKNPTGTIRVKCIDFTDRDQSIEKSFYFFNENIADENAANRGGMIKFIESYKKRSAFMKAAQCSARNPNFSTLRRLVLESDVVIQDDSAIPYKSFVEKGDKVDIKLFGTYTRVIDDLSWCYQKDLRKDLESIGDTKKLPFKITYNGNYGEGVLIYVRKKDIQ